MTAPDRIWVRSIGFGRGGIYSTVDRSNDGPCVEYVRADLATPAAMTPEVRALVERWDTYVESMGSVMGEVEHMAQQMRDALAALPAVTVGVKPLGADGVKIHPQDILNAAWRDDLGEEGLAMYDRILAALKPVTPAPDAAAIRKAALEAAKALREIAGMDMIGASAVAYNAARELEAALAPQPVPDAAAIREAWEKAYWRMRSYAVHDNDCKLNKPPRFDGPCSCGLTAALEEAAALLTEKPRA